VQRSVKIELKIKKERYMYHHLTKNERDQIAVLRAQGQSHGEIAAQLNRHKSTISREIKRNKNDKGKYLSCYAQDKSDFRKHNSHKRERLRDTAIRQYVIDKIKLGWSPDIISGRIKIDHPSLSVSHEAIYQYIYLEDKELGLFLPRRKVKRQPKSHLRKGKKPKIPNRTPIDSRPESVNDRSVFGHYESDSIVSRESKAALNVLVERKSRYTIINWLHRKTAEETLKAIIISLSKYTPYVSSITYDNGTEFVCHEQINSALEASSYFCQPYHSWEKGSVENRNWFIRRFLPKKTDFSKIDKSNIIQIQDWINNRPMRCLDYKTPKEVFDYELKRCA
jgi:IS30 family transposase